MWRETCLGILIPGFFPRAQRRNAAARSVAQESCRQMRRLIPNKGDFLCVPSGLCALRVELFSIQDFARFLIFAYARTV
jgi:hypothetical protein